MTGIDLFLWSMPQHRGRTLVQCAHPSGHVGGKNLIQLGQGRDGRLLQTRDAAINGTSQTNDNGGRFIVIEKKRWETTTATELVATGPAGHRLNRIAQVT
jgi:hypothetical protein